MHAFAVTRSDVVSTSASEGVGGSGTHDGVRPVAIEATVPATQSSVAVHITEDAAHIERLTKDGELPPVSTAPVIPVTITTNERCAGVVDLAPNLVPADQITTAASVDIDGDHATDSTVQDVIPAPQSASGTAGSGATRRRLTRAELGKLPVDEKCCEPPADKIPGNEDQIARDNMLASEMHHT
ncbi:uncharacterized protein LOC119285284 [Triticum dicoccoides]|uniref:uncharacterized protein LOC119285284 n=1 Tax=Triticum dicoccoides TaxID=85692 RepID=UPI00189030DE|nr:uncharacterized protein LOC119285284 [Triticum dicoccoides]